jgi:CheY-like chemotaxis protein
MQPILIIDDDADDLELIRLAIQETGFDHPVICFRDALTALAYLRESYKAIFCIISDINMPLMDGFGLQEELSKLRYAIIPFILLSTSASKGELALAKIAGMHDCLCKPHSFDVLVQMMRSLILQLNGTEK